MQRKLFLLLGLLTVHSAHADKTAATNTSTAIPWAQIGARAGADYQGDGLAVTPSASGARLHCLFQRLEGEATAGGLWLTSSVANTTSDRFRVLVIDVGRQPASPFHFPALPYRASLAAEGSVSIAGQTVSFSRPALREEYSVSLEGVRQDFIVEQAPACPPGGELIVKLGVSGARVEPAVYGAQLVLEHSGRRIAFSRLRVTDATGRELPARIEVCALEAETTGSIDWSNSGGSLGETNPLAEPAASARLAVVVEDAGAVYPVRIDPTFSDASWVSLGVVPGIDGTVDAAVFDDLGNLYVGGSFSVVGGAIAKNVAQWNGTNWSALGPGMNGEVHALAVSDGTLYAAGSFTMAGGNVANYVAQWDGTNWSALGSGMGGLGEFSTVYALAVSDGGTLYAGGAFYTAGDNPANCIAQWDGSSWSALGSGMGGAGQFTTVNALAVSDGGTLYVGGAFYTAGGNPANFIAQWNGGWSALGSGMGGPVNSLAVSGYTLYAGGHFTRAGGNAVKFVAQWDGNDWSTLGPGINSDVNALLVSGDTLYAGGVFNTVGGNLANYIAQWNGTNWSTLGSGMDSDVNALALSGGTLYAGGRFSTAGGNAASHVAQWNGTNWSAFGSGLNTEAQTMAVLGGTLYAGGSFTVAGVNRIAQWNGTNWSALGSGVSGGDFFGLSVQALAVSGGTLYVGGDFTTAGGNTANYIAQWNGTNWSALGSGTGGGGGYAAVFALAASGGTLYAGGRFTTAGDNPANYIAQWNGSDWSVLGSGMGGGDGGYPPVYALAVSGGKLYAGGAFTTADGNAANYIAQWNGSGWSPLGSGMNGEVKALAASGGKLYAGGRFTTAGGNAVSYIAQWNGTNWSALGSGMNADVEALAVSGGTLYAGGNFTTAGGNAANYIAQWNGTNWSPLASGVNNKVDTLAVSSGALFVGGAFSIAGGKVSAYAAEVILPVSFAIITTNAAFGFTNGVFGFDLSGPSGSNVVIEASPDLRTWIPLQTNLFGGGLLHFSDSQSATNRQRCYRAALQ